MRMIFKEKEIFVSGVWKEQEHIDVNLFNNMVLFSDESTFHKNKHANRHSLHDYADENAYTMSRY